MSEEIIRFEDQGYTVYTFGARVYVECPRCQKPALSQPHKEARMELFRPRRLTCTHCGHSETWEGRSVIVKPHEDWYFGHPLWLSAPCLGDRISAMNPEHLDYLESFIAAQLREREVQAFDTNPFGWRNAGYISRLPKWMKAAENREPILKVIANIRKERLPV